MVGSCNLSLIDTIRWLLFPELHRMPCRQSGAGISDCALCNSLLMRSYHSIFHRNFILAAYSLWLCVMHVYAGIRLWVPVKCLESTALGSSNQLSMAYGGLNMVKCNVTAMLCSLVPLIQMMGITCMLSHVCMLFPFCDGWARCLTLTERIWAVHCNIEQIY